MKQLIILLSLLATTHLTSFAYDKPTKAELLQIGLPVLQIETINHEEPTYEKADPPQGCLEASIRNATKVPGRVVIETLDDGIVFDSGEYLDKESGMTIKVRGNTSALFNPKKPYKIKLQKKGDMLCSGNDLLKDKNWLLLRVDNMNTVIGLKASELLNMPWTPRYEFVNVIFNDDNRGLYLLMESVERNTDCRLNVDKTTGFIAELDAYWWNEDFCIPLVLYSPELSYTFKYPDTEDITPEQAEFFKTVLQTFEKVIQEGGYASVIDEDSFSKWILALDILGNIDSAGTNLYLTKYDHSQSSLLTIGCLWDFDNILKSEDYWSQNHTHYIFKNLFFCSDKSFAKSYIKLWEEKGTSTIEQLTAFVDSLASSTLAEAVNASNALDYQRWKIQRGQVTDYAEKAKEYIAKQGVWLKENIAEMARQIPDETTTELPKLYKEKSDDVLYGYSASGIRQHGSQSTTRQRRDVYIINGKKMIK
ncbi:MAG: CotH kinase family protein [Prevotella sp.]|nr:CotH kinase family protein [Prevotella sp.]